jgi:hypothetical protein
MLDVLRPVPKKRTVRLKTKKGVLFKSLSHGERLVFYLSSLFAWCLDFLLYLAVTTGAAASVHRP